MNYSNFSSISPSRMTKRFVVFNKTVDGEASFIKPSYSVAQDGDTFENDSSFCEDRLLKFR